MHVAIVRHHDRWHREGMPAVRRLDAQLTKHPRLWLGDADLLLDGARVDGIDVLDILARRRFHWDTGAGPILHRRCVVPAPVRPGGLCGFSLQDRDGPAQPQARQDAHATLEPLPPGHAFAEHDRECDQPPLCISRVNGRAG